VSTETEILGENDKQGNETKDHLWKHKDFTNQLLIFRWVSPLLCFNLAFIHSKQKKLGFEANSVFYNFLQNPIFPPKLFMELNLDLQTNSDLQNLFFF